MKWINGRANNSGYQKLLLFESKRFKFDCYILKYPKGSYLDWHTDEVKDYKHYRFNWTFWKALVGGICKTIMPPIWKCKCAYLFRPDNNLHSVTAVEKGTRYVFSFGWLRK